jgi:UDP-3-O-[3-hydroxymyristoyl] glucosamine N-acyltransferase
MQVIFSAADLAAIVGAHERRGATGQQIRGIATLAEAAPGDLAFLGNAKYKSEVPGSRASVVLLPKDFTGEPAADQLFLLVDNPSVALARVCARLEQQLWPKPAPGVHASAVVAAGAEIAQTATVGPLCVVEAGAVIGERTHLQAQVFVGRNARVGDDCWVMPGVVVAAECQVGRRVRLHSGVVIGSDGFGYEFVQGRHEKVPQVGLVQVGDDVEIGANSTLDRARFGRTTVGEGTKIDNLVQIAHNVRIGRHCILCAQTGISGSTTLEDYVVLGGQAGLGGHITLGKGAKVGGGAGVAADVAPGAFVNGNPAIPFMLERRVAILRERLPDLFRRVDALEAQLGDAKKLSPVAAGSKMPLP